MVRPAALIAVASRAQMLAIPVATTMRSVPASSMRRADERLATAGCLAEPERAEAERFDLADDVEIDVRRRAVATDPHADPSEPRAEGRVGPLVSAGVDHV